MEIDDDQRITRHQSIDNRGAVSLPETNHRTAADDEVASNNNEIPTRGTRTETEKGEHFQINNTEGEERED